MEKKSATFANDLIVLWCNGSTTVFGSVSGGSNPPGTTSRKTTPQALGLRGCFFILDHVECYLLMRLCVEVNVLLGISNVLLLSTLRKLHQLL